jgi:hypothetical protein
MTDVQNRAKVRYVVASALAMGAGVGAAVGLATSRPVSGWHAGFWAAVLLGLALHKILRVKAFASPAEGFEDGETVLHRGPANHFRGIVAVGGTLFLTDRRLRFRAHALNVRRHDDSFARRDILGVSRASTLLVIPNAIRVHLRDGRSERFVVFDRAEWIARLR